MQEVDSKWSDKQAEGRDSKLLSDDGELLLDGSNFLSLPGVLSDSISLDTFPHRSCIRRRRAVGSLKD